MSDLEYEISLDDSQFTGAITRAGDNLVKFQNRADDVAGSMSGVDDASKKTSKSLRDLAASAYLAETAFHEIRTLFREIVGGLVETNASIERSTYLLKSMSTAADPIKDATQQLQRLRDAARETPFALKGLTDAFIRLKAAKIEDTFESLADGVAAFGGTDETMKHAALAMQEMAGKGVIEMKELRNQLGNAMPRAAELMARSMGVSYGEFVKQVRTGTVEAKASIASLSDELERTFGGEARRQMQTYNGLMTQVHSLMQQLAIDAGNATSGTQLSFFNELKKQVQDVINFLSSGPASAMAQSFGTGLASVLRDVRALVDGIVSMRHEIIAAGEAFLVGFAISKTVSLIEAIADRVEMLGKTITSVTGRIRALGEELPRAFNGGSGTLSKALATLRQGLSDATNGFTLASMFSGFRSSVGGAQGGLQLLRGGITETRTEAERLREVLLDTSKIAQAPQVTNGLNGKVEFRDYRPATPKPKYTYDPAPGIEELARKSNPEAFRMNDSYERDIQYLRAKIASLTADRDIQASTPWKTPQSMIENARKDVDELQAQMTALPKRQRTGTQGTAIREKLEAAMARLENAPNFGAEMQDAMIANIEQQIENARLDIVSRIAAKGTLGPEIAEARKRAEAEMAKAISQMSPSDLEAAAYRQQAPRVAPAEALPPARKPEELISSVSQGIGVPFDRAQKSMDDFQAHLSQTVETSVSRARQLANGFMSAIAPLSTSLSASALRIAAGFTQMGTQFGQTIQKIDQAAGVSTRTAAAFNAIETSGRNAFTAVSDVASRSGNALSQFGESVRNAAIRVGEMATGLGSRTAGAIEGFVSSLARSRVGMLTTAAGAATVEGALGATSLAMRVAQAATTAVGTGFAAAGTAATLMAGGLSVAASGFMFLVGVIGEIAPWLPLLGAAVAFVSERFDIFGSKTSDAWKELEQFGAVTRETVDAAQKDVDRLTAAIQRMQDSSDTYTAVTGASMNEDIQRSIDDLEHKRHLLEDAKKRLAQDEAKRGADQVMRDLDEEIGAEERAYDQKQLNAERAHNAALESLRTQHKSTLDENHRYAEESRKAQMETDAKQLETVRSLYEKQMAIVASGDAQAKAIAERAADALIKRMQEIQKRIDDMKARAPGIPSTGGKEDEEKLFDKGVSKLQEMTGNIEKMKEELAGGSGEAAKLAYFISQAKFGPNDSVQVQELTGRLMLAAQQADILQGQLRGKHQLDTINGEIDDLKAKIIGMNGEAAKFDYLIAAGRFGPANSEEARRLAIALHEAATEKENLNKEFNAVNKLQQTRADVESLFASLTGASGAAAKIAAEFANAKFGPQNSAAVRELANELGRAAEMKEKLDQLMKGKNEFDNDIEAAQAEAVRKRTEAIGGSLSQYGKFGEITAKILADGYKGYGTSEGDQVLKDAQEYLSDSSKQAKIFQDLVTEAANTSSAAFDNFNNKTATTNTILQQLTGKAVTLSDGFRMMTQSLTGGIFGSDISSKQTTFLDHLREIGSVWDRFKEAVEGTSFGNIFQSLTGIAGTMQNLSVNVGGFVRSASGAPLPEANYNGPNKVAPNQAYQLAYSQVQQQGLAGTVPSDGAKYGITTGSPDEWARFLVSLAAHESGLDNTNVGDIGKFGSGSRGLYQLSVGDAPRYGLNGGKNFTEAQLADPAVNTAAAVAIMKDLVTKNNSIYQGAGQYWGPFKNEGWTPGNGRDRGVLNQVNASQPAVQGPPMPPVTLTAEDLKNFPKEIQEKMLQAFNELKNDRAREDFRKGAVAQNETEGINSNERIKKAVTEFQSQIADLVGGIKNSSLEEGVRKGIREGKYDPTDLNDQSDRYKSLITAVKQLDEAKKTAAETDKKNRAADEAGKKFDEEQIASKEKLAAAQRQFADPTKYAETHALIEQQIQDQKRLREVETAYGKDSPQYKTAADAAAQSELNAAQQHSLEIGAKIKQQNFETEQSFKTQFQSKNDALQKAINDDLQLLANDKSTGDQRVQLEATVQKNISDLRQKAALDTPMGKMMQQWNDLGANFSEASAHWVDGLTNEFANFITTGKMNFQKMFASIAQDIVKMILHKGVSSLFGSLQQQANQAVNSVASNVTSSASRVEGSLGGAKNKGAKGGGFLGLGKLFGIAHTGAVIGGSTLSTTTSSLAAFAGAARYHAGGMIERVKGLATLGGLKSNEVPIITEEGEGVFTKTQMRSIGAIMNGADPGDHASVFTGDQRSALGVGGATGRGGMLAALMGGYTSAPRFHTGGVIGGASSDAFAKQAASAKAAVNMPGSVQSNINQPISVSPTINLTASGGSSEQNQDLASRLGRQVSDQIRNLMVTEMQNQLRQGGLLNKALSR